VLSSIPFVRNLHKLEPLTLTILITLKPQRVREGIETHARARVAVTTCTQVKKRAHNTAHQVYGSNKCSNLKYKE
jgi:hypothetical protein